MHTCPQCGRECSCNGDDADFDTGGLYDEICECDHEAWLYGADEYDEPNPGDAARKE